MVEILYPMRALRRPHFWRATGKRLTASVALVAYLAVSSGLPLPVAPVQKDRSRPYPCMDDPWGCTSPEECWGHCHHYTAAQRWAWAEAHNVLPPDYAELPAAEEQRTHEGREEAGIVVADGAGHHHHEHETGKQAPATRVGGGVSPLHSKNLATSWVSVGTTPAPSTCAWRPDLALTDRLSSSNRFAFRLSFTPPFPPPR